jgi:hypothetical protein
MDSQETTDDVRPQAGGKLAKRGALIAAILFVLPVLYVLSIGPVTAMVVWGWIDDESTAIQRIEACYEPLDCLNGTPLNGPFEAYIEWWVSMAQRFR